jgi:glyoxylase-like metal-dependent hydrolase (beta-lactamase superfamily II)
VELKDIDIRQRRAAAGAATSASNQMKIHAIQTGTVAVKTRQREGVGRGKRRLLHTFLDRAWTDPLPILAWAIEHPEGIIVVDAGETARASEPGYFPRWHPYFRTGLREWVAREQEVGPRLERLGLPPAEVRWLVLTHLHTDHAGGLHHFPKSEILVSRVELERAAGRMGRMRGYLNNRFPKWFRPRAVSFRPEAVGPFPESVTLTQAGDVRLVPVPGHTAGQLAVIVDENDGLSIFIAGDSSYSEELMLRGAVDGVAPDEQAARLTLQRIRAYSAAVPTVYLPSHDPESAARLAERRLVQAAPEREIA